MTTNFLRTSKYAKLAIYAACIATIAFILAFAIQLRTVGFWGWHSAALFGIIGLLLNKRMSLITIALTVVAGMMALTHDHDLSGMLLLIAGVFGIIRFAWQITTNEIGILVVAIVLLGLGCFFVPTLNPNWVAVSFATAALGGTLRQLK